MLQLSKKHLLLCLSFKPYFGQPYCYVWLQLNYFVFLSENHMIFGLFLCPYRNSPPKLHTISQWCFSHHFDLYLFFPPKSKHLYCHDFCIKTCKKSLYICEKKLQTQEKNRNKSYMKIARSWRLFSLIILGLFKHRQRVITNHLFAEPFCQLSRCGKCNPFSQKMSRKNSSW